MEKIKLLDAVEEMFIGPFGSALKNDFFVNECDGYCMVYEQKHAIKKEIGNDNRFVIKEKYEELKRFEVGPGDIIMSCRGTVGELYLLPPNAPKGIIHPSLMKIKVKKNIYNPQFLLIVLQYYLKTINNDGTSIKMAIKAKDLGNVIFPSPTLKEQNELINKINFVDNQINLKKELLKKIEQDIFSVYEEMFNDENRVRLGDICELHARIGWQGLTKKEYLTSGEYKLVTGVDFNSNNKINFESCVYVSKERYDQDLKIQIKNNDVLVTKDGTIGKVAIVENLNEPATLNSGVFVLRPSQNNLTPEFLMYSLLTTRFNDFIEKIKTGATIPHLNQKAFVNYELFLPSIEKQKKFSDVVQVYSLVKEKINYSIDVLIKLKDMLNYEYFI